MSFVHLHVYSQYSWLDGACIIDDLVKRAKTLKMPAVAITDRNSIAGALYFSRKCREAGIKPVIGLEIAVLNDNTDSRAFSVILLAQNLTGFYNLSRLLTLAVKHDSDAHTITKTQLQLHSEGIICLSFSVGGEVCTLLLEDRDEDAINAINWYKSTFGDRYYLEIQNHGLPSEAIAMNKLLNLTYHNKTQVVLTNDCHYMHRKDSIAIDALNCIRKGIGFTHPAAKRFASNEYYFKTAKEMKGLFSFPPQLISNTLKIADSVDLDILSELPEVPYNWATKALVIISLRKFTSGIRIGFNNRNSQIKVHLPEGQMQAAIEHLKAKMTDYQIVPAGYYVKWAPKDIYATVLKTMGIKDKDVEELCAMIPVEAQSLIEAILQSTDFSCFALENYLYSEAFFIADKLMKTHLSKEMTPMAFAVIPKALTLPLANSDYAEIVCQFDVSAFNIVSIISLTLSENNDKTTINKNKDS